MPAIRKAPIAMDAILRLMLAPLTANAGVWIDSGIHSGEVKATTPPDAFRAPAISQACAGYAF